MEPQTDPKMAMLLVKGHFDDSAGSAAYRAPPREMTALVDFLLGSRKAAVLDVAVVVVVVDEDMMPL